VPARSRPDSLIAVKVFDLEVSPALIEEIAQHAERDYPIEACGVVLGERDKSALVRVAAMKNVQDKYHRRDPIAFSRDGRDAFRFDDLEHMRVVERAEAEGLFEAAIYHSHCDAGAYFSPEDRAMAVQDGIEMIPGAIHVVVSVRQGKRSDMAAYRFDAERRTFDEVRIPFAEARDPLPELAMRAMEGKEAARPIRPVGGALMIRRVTQSERAKLEHLAEKVQVRIDDPVGLADLARLELGLYSPLNGFMRNIEVRSVEMSGRLFSGTPWRAPVTLNIPAKKTAVLPAVGSLIELVDHVGRPRAAMGLTEVFRSDKDNVQLAGPVYVFGGEQAVTAADVRAELLRRQAKRVLAVRPGTEERVSGIDLSEFDAVLRGSPRDERDLPLLLSGRDPWLDAAMAQNQGATHIWVDDPATARAISETLAIAPWNP
jgi:[CysO sulfur-carrier protein]-S-L-cysteine hydrolase